VKSLPPMRLSRDLLTRGISYKLQERAYGGLSTATVRKLEQAAAGPPSRGAANSTPSVSLRPGTRLVREWHGVTHTALIHADGVEWRGQCYRSLSVSREGSRAPAGRARGSSASELTLARPKAPHIARRAL